MNAQIRVREVRLVDENGEQMGVLPLQEALQLAQERELDLVEVAPNSVPPVCRLLDYGKFRYLQTKREREARRTRKTTEVAEVRFRPRIGAHDLESKVGKIRELLDEGAKIRVSVMFRGREITHPELGVKILRSVAETLKDVSKLERAPAMEGRFMVIHLSPNAQPEMEKVSQGADPQYDAEIEDA